MIRRKLKSMYKKAIIIFIVFLLAIIMFFSSFAIIKTGYTGVRTTFGQVSEKPVSSGFNWKLPFVQSIKKVNNKQQDVLFTNAIWSETASRTALFFENVTVSYTINGEKSAWIYANIADYENSMLSTGIVASALKSASKTLSDTDATNRSKIEPLAQEYLQSSLNDKYGKGTIFINKITISNIDFEDSYNQAIADKQNAQLAYEKQKIENQKNVEKAEADAKVAKIKAQGVADSALIEAKGQAEANRELEKSLTDNVLKNRFYDTWDGALPKVSGEAGIILSSDFLGSNTPAKSEKAPEVTQ